MGQRSKPSWVVRWELALLDGIWRLLGVGEELWACGDLCCVLPSVEEEGEKEEEEKEEEMEEEEKEEEEEEEEEE